ncbi:hypothetical protein LG293_16725 (plasmid) [Citricoccus nitrophenolicus]
MWIYERLRADTAGRSIAVVRRTDEVGRPGTTVLELSVANLADPLAFHAFRQWDGSRWRNMAIIAHEMHTWCVADLDAGRVLATPPVPEVNGMPARGLSFYPHRFRVFGTEDDPSADGTWGIMSGCLYGDDDYFKVRYIDLSAALSGRITEDERFGYMELPTGVGLDAVQMAGPDTIVVPAAVAVHRHSGAVHPSTGERWNWAASPNSSPTS